MPTNNPRGFVEYRVLNGDVHPATRMFRARDNGDALQLQHQPIRAGDMVCLVSGNRVARFPSDTSAAPAHGPTMPCGVVRAVYQNGTGNRPRPFNGSPSTAYIAASADGWVEVNIDPYQTYLVNTDVTVTPDIVGLFVGTTCLATPPIPNRSGYSVALGSPVGVMVTAKFIQVLGLGAGDENDAIGSTGSPNDLCSDVEVVFGLHAFGNKNLPALSTKPI